MKSESVERVRFWEGARYVVGLFVCSRLLVIGLAILAPLLFKTDSYARAPLFEIGWTHYFNRWDVEWYRRVAVDGYSFVANAECNVVFFPLFPMLVRALHFMGIDALVAGAAISHACFASALWLFFRLVLSETGRPQTARRATALLAFSPAAVWFGLGLTESLFLFLTLALAAAAGAKRAGLTIVVGMLAGLTRPNGVMLVLPAAALAWPHLRAAWLEHRRLQALPWLLAVIGPLVGHAMFLLFLQIRFGDWRIHQTVAATQWHSHVAVGWNTLAQRIPGWGLRLLDNGSVYGEHVAWSWTGVLFFGALAAIALWEHRARPWHGTLLGAFFLFHAFLVQNGGAVGSIARYAAVVPAFYLGLALFAERRRWSEPVLLAVSVVAMTVQTLLVFAGYHIN